MAYPNTENNWNIQCDGKPTFFGVLAKYFDQIADKYHLNQSTKESYAKEYERHILPRINNGPLENYTAVDLELVIEEINSSGKVFAQSTLKHYRQLIKRVVEAAVQEEGMKDPLWGYRFTEVTTPKEVEEQERRTLPKSLTPLQQCAVGEAIYRDAADFGDMMGLMFTYETGLRLKESAGISIGDVQEQVPGQNFSCIAVHSATIGQTHERHNKPKTPNGYRVGVMGPRATEILQEKNKEIREKIDKGEIVLDDVIPEIEAIPLAGSRKDPLVPCSSQQLTQAYRLALRDAGYENEDYLALQRIAESAEFVEAERCVTPKELGFAAEKDPTAYSARRQFCTDMHIVGCTQEERQYAMGHRIENAAVDRRDFRNEDKFTNFADKLNKRPTTNPQVLEPKVTTMTGTSYQNQDFHSEAIRIPIKKGKIIIRISSHEPGTPLDVGLYLQEGMKVNGKYYEHENTAKQRREVNVLNDYYEAFRQAKTLLKQRKEADKQNPEEK